MLLNLIDLYQKQSNFEQAEICLKELTLLMETSRKEFDVLCFKSNAKIDLFNG